MKEGVTRFLKQKAEIEKKITKTEQQTNRLSVLRLVVFLLAGIAFCLGVVDHQWMAMIFFVVFLILFFVLVIIFTKRKESLDMLKSSFEIYNRYVSRYSEDWKKFEENGQEYLSEEHCEFKAAGMDLDIFGKASLFQYMNVAVSSRGKDKLKEYLTFACSNRFVSKENVAEIQKRQKAVLELCDKESHAMHLEAIAYKNKLLNRSKTQSEIYDEQDSEENASNTTFIWIFAGVCLAVTWVSLILACIGVCSYRWFAIFLAVQLIVSQFLDGSVFAKSYGAIPCLHFLSSYETYLQEIAHMEYDSELLCEVQSEIKKDSKKGIRSLKVIGEALQFRHNPIVYGLLCMLCLYNIFVYLSFDKWKKQFQNRIPIWLDCIGEMEALLSLAVIGRTKENTCVPKLMDDKQPYIKMNQMCHPLICENSVVANDVELQGQIRLITGSNMSGKTTYLRTLGVNMILAYAGANVCAQECQCSVMNIFTSMRIVDDVSNGISTFYAEVLRIKQMVSFCQEQQPMLVLIDEIFKGTNSADRIVGAKGVICALLKNWVVGMVSTHDFELCQLSKEYKKIENYHFDEYFSDEKLCFSYQIKEGRCTTTNALHILKMAGIETE